MSDETGESLIEKERARQKYAEGYTDEHDDNGHDAGELARAGEAYENVNFELFPWAAVWWKPRDPLSNLVRAGALYQAEIDALTRRRNRVARKIDQLLTTKEVT